MRSLFFFAMLAVVAQSICPYSGGKVNGADGKEVPCPHLKKQELTSTLETTVQGCTCSGECSATVTDGFNCEWCYTQNNCGISGVTGKWDYCVWPADQAFESQTWDKKLTDLWGKITADQTIGKPANPLKMLVESIQTSFDVHSDVMPPGRQKVIHGVGAVCKFKLQISSTSPFTGVLKANNVANGLIRMGSALAVDLSSGVVPGVGVKFLRSKVPSGNYVALNTLRPLPDNNYNFFEKTLSNHIPAYPQGTKEKVLMKKFGQASTCVTMVGLSDICSYDNDGAPVGTPKFPFELTMDSRIIQFLKTPVMQDQLQEQLAAIPSGTKLYEIGYHSDPKSSKSGAAPTVLGTMVTDGPCVNSKFGDESLFFRHQLVEEDFKLEPTWPGYLDGKQDCAYNGPLSGTPPRQCSAATPKVIFEEAM